MMLAVIWSHSSANNTSGVDNCFLYGGVFISSLDIFFKDKNNGFPKFFAWESKAVVDSVFFVWNFIGFD